jgi:hypothetical protein
MKIKTKNLITAVLLAIFALSVYVAAVVQAFSK